MNHTAHLSHPTVQATTDYIVVVSNEEDHHAGYHHFAEKVNRRLKSGYQLHGPPFSVGQVLCQAMIRLPGTSASGDTTNFFKQTPGYHG